MQTLRRHARYVDERELEIRILTSPAAEGDHRPSGPQLASFRDL